MGIVEASHITHFFFALFKVHFKLTLGKIYLNDGIIMKSSIRMTFK